MILCAICKRPILDADLYAVFDRGLSTGKSYVHANHAGVRELYLETYGNDRGHLGIGVMLKLRPVQVKRIFGRMAPL